jgi:hypothetical protein
MRVSQGYVMVASLIWLAARRQLASHSSCSRQRSITVLNWHHRCWRRSKSLRWWKRSKLLLFGKRSSPKAVSSPSDKVMGGGYAAWCGWSHWRPKAGDSRHLLLSMVPSNKLFMMSFISYNFSYPLQTFFYSVNQGRRSLRHTLLRCSNILFLYKAVYGCKRPTDPFPLIAPAPPSIFYFI